VIEDVPTCPACGHRLGNTTPADGGDDRPINAGDLSVCLYCAEVVAFTDTAGNVRALTIDELDKAMRSSDVRRAVRNVHRWIAAAADGSASPPP
jgi:hypothetical protein